MQKELSRKNENLKSCKALGFFFFLCNRVKVFGEIKNLLALMCIKINISSKTPVSSLLRSFLFLFCININRRWEIFSDRSWENIQIWRDSFSSAVRVRLRSWHEDSSTKERTNFLLSISVAFLPYKERFSILYSRETHVGSIVVMRFYFPWLDLVCRYKVKQRSLWWQIQSRLSVEEIIHIALSKLQLLFD